MNFWLEYMHESARGKGYKMNAGTLEILGQMMIDDSNWFTTNAEDMTMMVGECHRFVSFHGLGFNEKKCEYMVVNQRGEMVDNGGCQLEEWTLPRWPSGGLIQPKARKVEDLARWKKEHAHIIREKRWWEGSCLNMFGEHEEQPVTKCSA